ncbi:MAG: tetratricopeptide repeat protein [Acidipila sp.]|nr:tetratricopeptide repeat protein [Acidipila sp.]
MAFNKIKHVESAHKLLAQGKVPQAIGEYQQILKMEPNDQVTLMTVGDLYVRQGDSAQATSYFEKLAQVFLEEGFITKAIAIYKKIAKLSPDALAPLERLSELYVQQGVMSEARPIYIQIAEAHLRTKHPEKAVEVLRRLLDLEPDNLRVQMRLAELYQTIGQKSEAAHAYTVAAHRVFEKGEHDAALALLDRAIELDKANPRSIMLKARVVAAMGRPADGAKLLETLPDAEQGEATTTLLLELYQQAGHPARAVEIAKKVLAASPEKFELGLHLINSLLEAGEPDQALGLADTIRVPMTEAGEKDRLAQVLGSLAERLPKRLEPREWLVVLYQESSDSFRLIEALDQLGDTAVSAGELERAQEVFTQLLEREPQNEHNRRRLSQVRTKLGLEPLEAADLPMRPVAQGDSVSQGIPVEEAPAEVVVTESAETAALGESATHSEKETQRYITQALTDVDLFSSYNLTQKAIDLLENVLSRAPGHPAALEKLLDLYLGAGNDRRTAELAAQLEEIYKAKGDQNRIERFADLRRRFTRASELAGDGEAPAAAAAPEFAVTAPPAAEQSEDEAAQAQATAPAASSAMHEMDISDDWAAIGGKSSGAVEAHSTSQEMTVPVSSEESSASATEHAAAQHDDTQKLDVVRSDAQAAEAPEYDLELSTPAPSQPGGAVSTQEILADLARELETIDFGEGASQPAAAPAPEGTPGAKPPVAVKPAGEEIPGAPKDHLREVFDEFRAELGEMGEEEEDIETHYNLGIAYREMDLGEESIAEFQKVAKLVQGGRPFRYSMQCYTLLGLAFMAKGEPKIAALWYEKALRVPGLDPESILALRYDLGVAQELAGEGSLALDSFTQVYAMNIDYRDVADRIAGLQKRR